LNDNWSFVQRDLTLVTISEADHFMQQDAADLVSRRWNCGSHVDRDASPLDGGAL